MRHSANQRAFLMGASYPRQKKMSRKNSIKGPSLCHVVVIFAKCV
jgi:hypothetical protein